MEKIHKSRKFEFVVDRSSHRRCSVKKGVLRNLAKFTGKHLCQRLFFNKVAGLRPKVCNFIKKESLAKVLSCEFCEISKETFFTDGRLLLSRVKIIPKSTLHCYLGNKSLFIQPEKVSFWQLFFRVRHFQSRQKIIMQFQEFQITCNVWFWSAYHRFIPTSNILLIFWGPPPPPVYVVLLSVLQLEYIFTFVYNYSKILQKFNATFVWTSHSVTTYLSHVYQHPDYLDTLPRLIVSVYF